MMTAPIPVALPLAHSGKVRMLGVTTKDRVGAIPDVPALSEIGVPGYNAPSWFMLVAPGKTPRAIVDKLHADLRRVLSEADVREEFIQRQGLIRSTRPRRTGSGRRRDGDSALGGIVRKASTATQ
jgi:tripartite-type tricarboxylate transporter receptor subunit TctC